MDRSSSVRLLTDEDKPQLISFLQMHAETSLFMLSNLKNAQVNFSGKRYEGEYFGVFNQGQLKAVLVQYWSGHIHAQGQALYLKQIWREIYKTLRPVQGFVGNNDLCKILKEEYSQAFGAPLSLSLDSNELLYRLTLDRLVIPKKLQESQYSVHLASPENNDFLLPWMYDYNVAALNCDLTAEKKAGIEQNIHSRIEANTLFVLYDGEVPVSTASFNAIAFPFVQIGGVWTPPEFRRQGFAQMAVAGSLIQAQQWGYELSILFTDMKNISARTAYERIGFEQFGEFGLYLA